MPLHQDELVFEGDRLEQGPTGPDVDRTSARSNGKPPVCNTCPSPTRDGGRLLHLGVPSETVVAPVEHQDQECPHRPERE